MKTALVGLVSAALLMGCTTSGFSVAPDRDNARIGVAVEGADALDARMERRSREIAVRQCDTLGFGATAPSAQLAVSCAAVDASGTCRAQRVERTYACRGNAVAEQHLLVPDYVATARH